MSKADIAAENFKKGYNCCQSVVCSFADEVGVDESVLYKVSEGFGAGMGTGNGVCGAISGAAMVAGLLNSDGDIDNPGQTKRLSVAAAGQLQKAFAEKAGGVICRDIKTGNNGGPFTSCIDCIRIAAEIAEEKLGL